MPPTVDAMKLCCSSCHYTGPDLRVEGCGCAFHARCIPLENIMDTVSPGFHCPACRKVSTSGLYVFPLNLKPLEEAIKLRKESCLQGWKSSNKKRPREEDISKKEEYFLIENSFAVYAQGCSFRGGSYRATKAPDVSRNGRWNDDEVAYTDYLVSAFENGRLPIPNGTKLNQFLGEILLCKASRLTKKMKNARLSTRSYERCIPAKSRSLDLDAKELSRLEDLFVASLNSETLQLEVRFNLSKQWRSYLTSMFLQVGNQNLELNDWMSSIEEVERRASSFEDKLGHSGLLRTSANNYKKPRQMSQNSNPEMSLAPGSLRAGGQHEDDFGLAILNDDNVETNTKQFDEGDDFGVTFLDRLIEAPETQEVHATAVTAIVEESSLGSISERQSSQSDNSTMSSTIHRRRTFMDAIAHYMEQYQLPFQHADCWAPAASNNIAQVSSVRLLHAGSVTRKDIAPNIRNLMDNFGEYSADVSFGIGEGLPGRVFATSEAEWVYDMRAPGSKPLSRVSDAIANGVRTAAGVPLDCLGVGKMVLVVYSHNHVQEDLSILSKMSRILAQYQPRPKWSLFIDINLECKAKADSSESESTTRNTSKPKTLIPSTAIKPQESQDDDIYCSLEEVDPIHSLTESSLVSWNNMINSEGMASTDYEPSMDSSGNHENSRDEILDDIVELLGSQVTPSSHPRSFGSQSPCIEQATLNEVVALRFFLLRARRSSSVDEMDLVETLKSSYQSYRNCQSNRGRADLCKLLVQDWLCLKTTKRGVNVSQSASVVPMNAIYGAPEPLKALPARSNASTLPTNGLPLPPPMAHSTHLLMSRSQSMPRLSHCVDFGMHTRISRTKADGSSPSNGADGTSLIKSHGRRRSTSCISSLAVSPQSHRRGSLPM